MRKNALIKMLQEIEGNPEVVFWNGYVEDYMNIDSKTTKITLVKESEKFLFDSLRFEWCSRNNTFDIPEDELEKLRVKAKDLYAKRGYDFANPFVTEEEYKNWYNKKTLTKVVLSPKLRDKTSYGMHRGDDLPY